MCRFAPLYGYIGGYIAFTQTSEEIIYFVLKLYYLPPVGVLTELVIV
jgi:hypothetical protein